MLREAARAAGLSLNEYCARTLVTGTGPMGPPAFRAVERAGELFGKAVVGVLVYGSWARGEMSQASDVDLLIVLDRDVLITRDLYRDWDDPDLAPLEWDSCPVEPHFSHLPDPQERISGLWAEVAIDGLPLFERSFKVSRTLAAIRRRILQGEVERRRTFGHPYWVAATDDLGPQPIEGT